MAKITFGCGFRATEYFLLFFLLFYPDAGIFNPLNDLLWLEIWNEQKKTAFFWLKMEYF